jgi:hypothetical protein
VCATLHIAAIAFVLELCERNPKRIKRWPYLVLPTRRTTCTRRRSNKHRLKIKLSDPSSSLGLLADFAVVIVPASFFRYPPPGFGPGCSIQQQRHGHDSEECEGHDE